MQQPQPFFIYYEQNDKCNGVLKNSQGWNDDDDCGTSNRSSTSATESLFSPDAGALEETFMLI